MVFILVITISVIIRSMKTMLPLSLGEGVWGKPQRFQRGKRIYRRQNGQISNCVFSERMSSDSEKKFWQCPDLVEKVLPFLDSYSTLHLAQASRKCYFF